MKEEKVGLETARLLFPGMQLTMHCCVVRDMALGRREERLGYLKGSIALCSPGWNATTYYIVCYESTRGVRFGFVRLS